MPSLCSFRLDLTQQVHLHYNNRGRVDIVKEAYVQIMVEESYVQIIKHSLSICDGQAIA